MRRSVKKTLAMIILGMSASISALPAVAYWGHHHHHYYPGYYSNDGLATGLIFGGMVGVLAGAAMADSRQSYRYPVEYCHQEREAVWSHRFCDEDGCFVKTKWRNYTVCD